MLGDCLGRPPRLCPFTRLQRFPGAQHGFPGPASLAFDDVVIDFAGRRLLRAGVEQPLEPKAFGVLALLAGAPGRAFARDEILDAVWGHRHVTPGVLNRVMTLLRHALGEDAQLPRYLRTVHGVGYRFDLPAPPLPADEPEPTDAADAAPTADTDAPRRRTGDPPSAAAPRRRWPWLLGLVVLLALVALGGARWRQPAVAPPRRPASTPR